MKKDEVKDKQVKKVTAPGTAKVLYRRLIRDYVSHYKGRLTFAILFMLVSAFTTTATAYLMKPIVDEVFFEKDQQVIYYTVIAIAVIFSLRGMATFGQSICMSWIGNRVVADIQRDLFKKLIIADLAWLNDNSTGQLISRFVYDTNLLRAGATTFLVVMTKDTLTAVFLIGSLFYYDWQMALLVLIALPPGAIAIRQLGKRARKASTHVLDQTANFSTFLEETFNGIRVIKSYNKENDTRVAGDAEIYRRFKLQHKAMRIQVTSTPVVETLSGAMIAGVILYGANSVATGDTTPGTFFAFITAVMLAYQPIKSVAKIAPQMQNSMAAADRIFSILDVTHNIVEKPGAAPLELHEGRLEFDHVSFSYDDRDEKVLKSISLTVEPGQRVALVGPSGGGKSTILNLLPRFYDVTDGEIRVDNQNIQDVTIQSLRDQFSLVSQDIFLFDDSIRANIMYGREKASEEDMMEAARSAAIHDFICSLPEGYDTRVGNDGVRLSGGQRQRIAIARAILKDAPILLLDEATSALDTEAERKVQLALSHLMKGRTSMVIAHRLSTILDADVIYVIDAGEVVEAGKHSDLLSKNGVYADLYNNQFKLENNVTSLTEITKSK
ncbi:ATP-binding cassette domain-containing protein [Sneathiella sp. P13V-1]|uniref:ABC transporter ATP-binding protein n=1 Tax=Sneathiella sp. P13V-1 TaxID=2697366 RepID=UPI00187B26E6|nr:ABC transporter transmembrane domain-containing protein [Sneathiella sp. P13V-1]MBE7636378.1 ATP-binding cassette domain-containing protein [Sneathiella sp. P13V-1]